MTTTAWISRLTRQLPGWHVWHSGHRWNAVPAPAGVDHIEALALPGRLSAHTPQLLRGLARARYGWDDYCGTCNVLARQCGHRQPERRDTSDA